MMRARWMVLFVVLAIGGVAAACGGDADSESSGGRDGAGLDPSVWSAEALSPDPDAVFVPLLINSNLGVGANRLVMALINRDGVTVLDAQVEARFFTLETEDGTDTVASVADAGELVMRGRTIVPSIDHVHPDGEVHAHQSSPAGVFVTDIRFEQSGWWGAELDARGAEGDAEDIRVKFFVREATLEPGVGDPAPRTTQPVLADVQDIGELDTSRPPNPEFHDMTVAEAIQTGKPVVVAFATPAFCQTQFCGPVLSGAVAPLAAQFGDTIEIVHIEPFDLAAVEQGEGLVAVPELAEWGLVTEPWVFVVGGDGTVAAKFEGIVEAEEIASVLTRLLG